MSCFLKNPIDIEFHNKEVKTVWKSFNSRKPVRVPVSVIGSTRYYLQNPKLNTFGWTFKDFFEDSDVQIKAQVEYQKWRRFNLLCDHEMGFLKDGWQVFVDFQNSFDPAWDPKNQRPGNPQTGLWIWHTNCVGRIIFL